MKIIFDDPISIAFRYYVIESLKICIDKINSKSLDNDDYDMIIEHLKYYKNLLEEAKENDKNN